MAWNRECVERESCLPCPELWEWWREIFPKNAYFFAFFPVMGDARERIPKWLAGDCFVANHFI